MVKNISQDAHFNEIQRLYESLGKLARDVVIVPQVQFETGINPHMGILQRKILYNEDVGLFRLPYEV